MGSEAEAGAGGAAGGWGARVGAEIGSGGMAGVGLIAGAGAAAFFGFVSAVGLAGLPAGFFLVGLDEAGVPAAFFFFLAMTQIVTRVCCVQGGSWSGYACADMREDQAYALDRAIVDGEASAVRSLLQAEPRLTGTPIPVERDWGQEMWLGLHRAAELGALEIVGLLLDAGTSVDGRTRFRTPMHGRETALLIASRCGHEAVVRLLLKRWASVQLLDATHRSALSHAAGGGHTGIVRLLIEYSAALDAVDDQQRTPLHWAIQSGHVETSLALIDAGAEVNHTCPKEPAGYTPLHRCASVGGSMRAVASRLIDAGADPSLRDPRLGRTPGEVAAENE